MTFQPMPHQAKSLAHGKTTDVVFDTSQAGTGKTAVCIWAYDERRTAKQSRCMLVIATRSLLQNAWGNDIKKFAPHLSYSIATAKDRAAKFAAPADIYITNHDAAVWLAQQPAKFFARFTDLVVDEGTAFKHHTSQRSKALAKIVKHFKYRRLLTATPNSNTICDVWHLVKLLDDGKRLGTSFYQFRNTVCEAEQVGPNANALRWTDKPMAEEAVFGLLADITIRHELKDLPTNVRHTIPFGLSAKQRRAYDDLEASSVLALSAKKVTAVNAAAVATKLLQVASGAVYTATDDYTLIDTGRYEMILDLVAERPHALVFFLWKHQRDLLVKEAETRGLKFAVLDGSTNDRERNEMVTGYQAGVYDVLFAHPRSAAHGLTFTRGTSTIWASPTYDLELFVQGSSRQHRIGQTQKTETLTVIAHGTLEEKVYNEILMNKDKRMGNLLDLFSTTAEAV